MADFIIPIVAVLFVVALLAGLLLGARRRRTTAPPRRPAREAAVTRPQSPPVVTEAPREQTTTPVEATRPSLRDRLGKSRRFFGDRLAEALGGGVDEDTWDDIEAVLIQADIGVETATRVTGDLRALARERRITDAAGIRALLADELLSLFDETHDRALTLSPEPPTVWLIVGVNGTGKTTTIGKLTADLTERGRSVALAAGDTFRAAADEQLGIWAERSGATLIKHQPGADPGAVAFDAYAHAKARGIDVLLVDTAGRLHTKTPLMDELGKIRRVIERRGQVHEALLVIDATAGQNGLVQARQFADSVGVTGVALTKLDGTAKGGIALAIETTLGLPIKVIGVGEGIDDLEPFDPKTFVDALLS
ncbi:MAG: signal recognition particle-docking protein FtsY [Actinomycetota bacterium]|nr:signal recognition particle-docking protein FtsY [Actinomycetota bacterium]